jgi:release factor glutamine methyltransferase
MVKKGHFFMVEKGHFTEADMPPDDKAPSDDEKSLDGASIKEKAPAAWQGAPRRAVLGAMTERLRGAGIESPRRNAEWMMTDVLGCSRAQVYAHPDEPVAPEAADRLAAMVARRRQREPIQYILGHTDFYGLRLTVTPDVLVPRPETEELVEAALRRLEGVDAPVVLDVGTGSGCIACALKHERPDATVHACDVSSAALAVARENAERHDLAIRFHPADLLGDTFAARMPASLDLLVANPPYVPDDEAATLDPEVRDYEPALALRTGPDPLRFYRALATAGETLLQAGGTLMVEAHADHAGGVQEVFEHHAYAPVDVARDLSGHPRIVTARRLAPASRAPDADAAAPKA